MMPTAASASDGRASASALQRIWLRELGMEKLWARSPAPAVTPTPISAAPPAYTLAEPAPVYGSSRPAAAKSAPAFMLKDAAPPPDSSHPPADLAHLNLDALCRQVQSCTACGLAHGRKQAVFGAGIAPAAWLIVGEAPGGEEDRQGLPFVGPSGQLLDAMLASVNRSRQRDVYIANVVKCRPPGNRNPKPEEINACNGYLMRQIALVNPDCIVVVGRFAAQTLLNTDAPVGSLRGRVHTLKLEAGREIPVIVSYHPAYLLRSPVEKAKAWADLQLAASAAS